jgi:ATPase subunit of ABC transporter with duplicated ATPase domains
MRKLTGILLSIFILITFVSVVDAANNKATQAAENDNKAAERAKDRLEKLREKRTATKSSEKRDEARKRSHVLGEITAISGTTITIQTKEGSTKTIFTDSETKFFQIGKGGKKKISLSNIKVGDRIAAVGIAKDEDSGLAKFVVKLTKPEKNRHSFFGKVKSISGGTLTLVHQIHTDRPAVTVKTTSSTKIKVKGKESASLSDVSIDDRVAVSGTVDEKGIITAKKLPKEATKSATKSATSP